MAKKKQNDRRAVVEQMRKEQQRKERGRTLLIVGSAVLVGVLIIGFAVFQVLREQEKDARDLSIIGVKASEAGCQEVVTEKAEGNNDHRPDGEDIDYPTAPPASGPHWGTYLQESEYRPLFTADDRPPVEQLVHSLEHGHTLIWYDETIADDEAQLDELDSLVGKFESDEKVEAVPWTSEDGEAFPDGTHIAMTHWSMGGTNGNPEGQLGVWQYCGKVSGEAVEDFTQDYPMEDSPEPTAP